LYPAFLDLAADSVRWRLLGALADGDLRVRELCARLGLAQNRVSYHLARLRSMGLVHRRRSDADGRDSYYALDLARCGALLSETGAALHPALRLVTVTAGDHDRLVVERRCRVLFACTGNSARSRIAEALMREMSGGRVEARSAGSHPKPLHPNTVRVLRERGIELMHDRSTHLDEVRELRCDYVITLCDRVREVCPEFPDDAGVLHWSIGDPARAGNSDEESYPAFRETLAELEQRIGFLLARIDTNREAA
jgi:protein-tyrosine-phosphatase/DNA-binding HxlR family transcriptional regulator